MPRLFNALRVLVDRAEGRSRFLILGSASPELVRGVSESLAGRVEFIELAGFDLAETGVQTWVRLWLRGGFPRSYLAAEESDSMAWREGFVRTFLERDIPQLGITIPAAAMRRFWTMLAHWHGQTWNASKLGRAMSLTDKTVRSYLDLLTGTFMVRQLHPWFENVAKRQVKAPEGVEAFLAKYQEAAKGKGVDPLGFCLQPYAYASLQVLGQAITATNGMDHAMIGEHIRNSEFDTVVGKVKFAPNGEWANTRVLMVQYQGVADNELATFAKAGTRVVLYPATWKSGASTTPTPKG